MSRKKGEKIPVCGKRLNASAFSAISERVLPAREIVGGSYGKKSLAGMRNEDRNSSSKTITYPSCSPGAHFHPSKRGKKSHRLRYAKYPLQGKLTHASQIYPHTTIRNHTTKHIHVFIHRQKGMEAVTRLCAGSPYTRRHSSSSRRALARPHGSQLGLVL